MKNLSADSLASLAEKLERKKREEIQQIERIEKDALRSLAESLRRSIVSELDTIESDTRKRLREIKEQRAKNGKEIIAQEKKIIDSIKKGQQRIEDEIAGLQEIASGANKKAWIIGLATGGAVMIGFIIGGWLMAEYANHLASTITQQRKELKEIEQKIENAKVWKGVEVYHDGAITKKKPEVYQTDKGDWAVIWRN